ncbi:hypothetical protein KIH74_31670 [Kineosporia sp. J2-2]|uniref:Uncharacterized protein n=1 Tax=Kineosporia corallincola TaxID=2835133 RepID=A0ABS5TRV9_9ACTN|nr:hypothetical protein [Kineosporia corallincola]MBT0773547.1 hypothetical protein [Kineosporia corallincola]
MSVPAALVTAAVEATEEHHELPLDNWVYPVIAASAFFVLFLLTYAFRNVSNKH